MTDFFVTRDPAKTGFGEVFTRRLTGARIMHKTSRAVSNSAPIACLLQLVEQSWTSTWRVDVSCHIAHKIPHFFYYVFSIMNI